MIIADFDRGNACIYLSVVSMEMIVLWLLTPHSASRDGM